MIKNRGNKGWKVVFFVFMVAWKFSFTTNVLALEDETKTLEVDPNVLVVDEEIETDVVNTEQKLEDVFNLYSIGIEFQNQVAVVEGNIADEVIAQDIFDKLDILKLKEFYHVKDIFITDVENRLLEDQDVVQQGSHIVLLGEDFIVSYTIQFLGDLNQDNILDSDDVDYGIDQVLNGNENISTEDVSYVDYVVKSNTYEVPSIVQEPLESNLQMTHDQDVFVGDEVSIQYAIHGFNQNYMNAISGKIIYNPDVLKLVDIYVLVDGEVRGKVFNNQFIYLFDHYVGEEAFLVLLFHTLKEGTTSVSIQEIKAVMNGTLLELNSEVGLEFVVQEYGKGGDINLPSNTIDSGVGNSSSYFHKENKVVVIPKKEESIQISNITKTIVLLSNDNYIKNLSIKGYSIPFDPSIYHYSIEVDEKVNSLEFYVLLSDENASYTILGNQNFKKGQNEVVLTVLAEDGSSRDYIIEVNKVVEDKGDNVGNNSNKIDIEKIKKIVLFLILICLILTIIWVIYRTIKEED